MDRDDINGHSIDDLERAYATGSEWKGPDGIRDHPLPWTHTHSITYESTNACMKGYGPTRLITRLTKVTVLSSYRDNGTRQTNRDSLDDDSTANERSAPHLSESEI